jgi:DNA-binding NtrC family response regulator
LIADDEYLIRWSLGQALSQEGYETVVVDNGEKAIEAIQAQPFDFIITDLFMPETDGWKLLEAACQSWPNPRVIIITGHGNEETRRLAGARGAWAYVEKPYLIDPIKAILKSVLPNE